MPTGKDDTDRPKAGLSVYKVLKQIPEDQEA